MTYASTTTVTPERSRAEIERVLTRYGATSFAYGWQQGSAVIAFRAHDRHVRFTLPIPTADDAQFERVGGRKRTPAQRAQAAAQVERSRWRALLLVIKAKLEAVESGIVTFEDEFLAHTMLPDGTTVGEWAEPQLAAVYSAGTMPALMPGAPR